METIQTEIIKVTCLTVQKWDTSEAESLWPDLQATDVKVRLTLHPGSIATDRSRAGDGNKLGSSQIYTVSIKCRCLWHLENYVRFYKLHTPPLGTRWTNACRRLCIEVRQCTTYNNHLQEICDLGNKKPIIRIKIRQYVVAALVGSFVAVWKLTSKTCCTQWRKTCTWK